MNQMSKPAVVIHNAATSIWNILAAAQAALVKNGQADSARTMYDRAYANGGRAVIFSIISEYVEVKHE